MSIKIYPDEPALIPIKYESNPLTPYSKEYSDIQDILICVKNEPGDDDDSLLIKYYKDQSDQLTGEVLLDESTNTFTLVKTENDSLPINSKGYRIFIGVTVAGLSKKLWLRVAKDQRIIVEEDGILS